jgi:hypothetical protein
MISLVKYHINSRTKLSVCDLMMSFICELQRQAARVILDADTTVRSANLFSKLRIQWLPLKKEIMVQKCSLIFRRIIGESPRYIIKLFPRNADLTNRASRHGKYNLECPRYNREFDGGRTHQISGIKLLNCHDTN